MKKTLIIAVALALLAPWTMRVQAQSSCTQTVTATQPFVEGFEGVAGTAYSTAGSLPDCWNGFYNGTTAGYMPHVVTGTGSYSYQHSGINSLVMTSSSTSTYGNTKIVMLPPMSVPLSQLYLSFWMCTESNSSGTLIVGYVTSDDTSSFTAIQSYPASAATVHNGNGPQNGAGLEVELSLVSVPADATRLAFKWYHNSTYYSCCIDDVMLSFPPSCPKVENLSYVPLATSATLSWLEAGTASSWEVVVKNVADATVDSVVTSANPYTVSSLDPNTAYTATVRAVCGATDISLPRSVTFRTLCESIPTSALPYTYGFEDATGSGASSTFNSCYGRHTSSTTAYPYSSTTYSNNGTYSCYFYSASSFYSYLTLPPFEDNIEDLYLTFWAYKTSAVYGHIYVGVMSNPDDLSTFDTIATLQVNDVSTWEFMEVSLASYTGNGGVIALLSPNTSAANYVYVDDIAVGYPPTCVRPTAVTLDATTLTSSSANLNIVHNDASSFLVLWHMVGETTWDTLEVNGTTFELQGLTMGMPYEGRVYTLCSSDTSLGFSAFSFAAGCGAIASADLPFAETFESYGTGAASPINACWAKGTNNTSTAYPYPYSTAAVNGNRGLYLYGNLPSSTTSAPTYSWVALPPVSEDLDMNTLMLTLNVKRGTTASNYYTTLLYVGIADATTGFLNADAIDTLVTWIDTLDYFSAAGSSVHSAEVSFANYTGTGKYVVLYAPIPTLHGSATYCYNYAYVDDVVLRAIPTCFWPTAVNIDQIGSEEVTLSWTPDARTANPSSWVVEYGVEGFTRGEGTIETVTSTTITLSNLLANTDYDVYISADCSGEVSDPAAFSFRTLCTALDSLPYIQTFEGAETGGTTSRVFVDCMTRLNNGSQYFGCPYVSGSSYNHTSGGAKGLYWTNSTTTGTYGDYQYVVMPGVNTDNYPINTLQLRFWACATGTSYNPVFQVGVMTNPLDVTTFQLVETVSVGNNTEFSEFIVALGTYTGEGQYVAIRALRPSTTWYAAVDDIILEEMPACPATRNLTASASVGSVLLNWEFQAGYDAPDSYVITYDTIGGTNPTIVSSSTNSVTITGLAASTSYKAYVMADCGTDGYGSMDSIEFTTGSLGCAQLDPASLDTVLFSNSTTGQSGCIAYSSYGNTVYQAIWTAAELTAAGLQAGAITGIDLGFTACSSYNKEFTIFIGSTSTTSISNATMEDPNQQTQVYGPAAHPTNTSGWQHYDFSTPFNWDGVSNIIITTFMNQPAGQSQSSSSGLTGYFVSAANKARYRYRDNSAFSLNDYNSGSSGTTYSYRAAIHFYSGDCLVQATGAAPNVSLIDVAATEVTIAWAPGYDETSWDVDYRISGDTAWTSAATSVTSTTYTFTNLATSTDYEFRVIYTATDGIDYYGVVSATTLCLPMTLPYTQDFDNITTSTSTSNYGLLPNCWDFELTGSSTYQGQTYQPRVYYSTTYAGSGNYCLYLYGVGYFMLPEVNAQLDSVRISFTDTITSTSYNGLEVGVMENGLFVPVQLVDLALNVRNQVEVSFRNYHGPSRTIALRSFYNGSSTTYYSYQYIDDIVVDYIPVCPHVENLVVDSVTENTIAVSWSPVGDVTSWVVSNGTTSVTVSDTNFIFTDLTANTAYTISVYSLCGMGDTSEAYSINTRTECGIFQVPYTEDFESYGTGSTQAISPCWTKGTNNTTAYPYPYATNVISGQRSLYFYAYHPSSTTSTAYYSYAALPIFQQPVNTLQLNFKVRRYATVTDYYTTRLVIGVMTDPTDISTFFPMDTLDLKDEAASSIHEYEYSFNNYSGNGQYIAIYDEVPPLYAGNTYSYSYAYVDDVMVDVIPSCPRVNDLAVSDILLSSATLSWSDDVNTGWNVEFDSVNFVPGTGHMTPIHVTDTFAVITGLDSATTYHAYVYPDCGTEIVYRHITFTTLAASPATVPYSCDFEAAGANGWDLVNGGQVNHWMIGNDVNNGGSRSLYITNDDSSYAYTITSMSYVFATRTFNLNAGSYICSYDWKAQGESSYDFIRAALVPANTVLSAGDYSGFDNATGMPANAIALDGAYRMNLNSTWQNHVEEFDVATPGLYKIVFLWRNDGSGGTQPPAAIDNVMLITNTCPRVEDVTANMTDNSISLTWTAGGSETSWQVTIGTTSTVVNTPAYTANGLTASTDYTISIRPICAVGDTGLAYTETFHTPCQAVSLPFSEDFDNITTGTATSNLTDVPNCWNYILTGSSTYQAATYYPGVYYSSSYAHSGSYSYRLYGEGYHMLPPMPVSLDTLQLTFWDYTTSASYALEVGVMEGNTFVPVQTISTPTSTHVEHTVYFGTYTGNSRIIAFHNYYTTSTTSNYSNHYIDNVEVDYLPSCAPVQNIHAVSASTDNIVVDWIDMSSASAWQVSYGTGSGNPTIITATAHPVTITGLDTLTTYTVSVRPICSATDTGEWSVPTSLNTEMCNSAVAATTGAATGTSYYAPVDNYYKYTLSETIIDSAELVGIGEISAIAYNYAHTTAMTKKTNVTIWLQPTTKSVFSSTTDLEVLDTTIAVRVYQGDLNCSQGWNYFLLDTTYTWNGQGNLMVIVDDNSNQYDGQAYIFNSSSCTGNKTLVWYSDTYDADPTSTTYSGTKAYYQYRPTMKLVSCNAGPCEEPAITTVAATETTVTINYEGTSTYYEVAIIENAWDEDQVTPTAVSAETYTFTGLTGGTTYAVGVRAVCHGTEYTDWVTSTITTDEHPCFVPTNLAVNNVTYTGAVLTWTPGENETAWDIRLVSTNDEEIIPATASTYTLTGLLPAEEYTVSVRSHCSETNLSDWSDPVTFRTDSCQMVTNVTASNVTANTAVISWTAPAGVTHFELEYGASGFGSGHGTLVEADQSTITLNGLTPNMAYDVYVRSICADGVSGHWANAVSFTTLEATQGIDDVANAAISLYPNPASSTVTISGISGEATVTVVDMNGRVVVSTQALDSTVTLMLTDLAQGAYFVRITGEQVNAIRKLIVR